MPLDIKFKGEKLYVKIYNWVALEKYFSSRAFDYASLIEPTRNTQNLYSTC